MSKIENMYELAEWVSKKAMTMIHNQTDKLLKEQKKLYEERSRFKGFVLQSMNIIEKSNSRIKSIYEMLELKERGLVDRHKNMQIIYDKMLDLDKKINNGMPLNKTDEEAEKIRNIPINDIVFSARTNRILTKNMGLKTLGDIALQTVQDLYMQKGFGNACFKEVKEVLNSYNICLREK